MIEDTHVCDKYDVVKGADEVCCHLLICYISKKFAPNSYQGIMYSTTLNAKLMGISIFFQQQL